MAGIRSNLYYTVSLVVVVMVEIISPIYVNAQDDGLQ